MTGYKIIEIPSSSDSLRPYESFIISTFLRDTREIGNWLARVDKEAFYKNYGALIKNSLDNPGGIVRMAILSDEPDTALGWSLCFGDTLLFIHVKKEFRKIGIGTDLMPPNLKRKHKKGVLLNDRH